MKITEELERPLIGKQRNSFLPSRTDIGRDEQVDK